MEPRVTEFSTVEVPDSDQGTRLDRWFAKNFPDLPHGRLQKMLRTGQIRVDGKRARAGTRLDGGEQVRVPPLARKTDPIPQKAPAVAPRRDEVEDLRRRVLYRDDDLIAIDKPAGLAVQGGSRQVRHLDALASALQFDAAEPPRLVHRLDKDTSGVLLLARHAAAARRLTGLFRSGEVRKIYWAVVVGVPKPPNGVIDLPLAKRGAGGRERMSADAEKGQEAVTRYRTIARSGKLAAWLALSPLTGRTHQLRTHCALAGFPILHDGKYGGKSAYLTDRIATLPRRLNLHARELAVPHPDGGNLRFRADLPDHMTASFSALGFDWNSPKAELDVI